MSVRYVLTKILFPTTLSAGIIGIYPREGDFKIIANYNGQADLLLSLQIPTDYYPYQFNKRELYDYLTNINRYIKVNNHTSPEKDQLKKQLQARLNSLLRKVKEFGPGLWDKSIYDTGLSYRNDQFWNNKKTSLLLIEQFIVDDYQKIEDAYNLLPIHKKLIITNHRAARDPYTIFPKSTYECFQSNTCANQGLSSHLHKYMQNYNQYSPNSLYRSGKYIEYWNNLDSQDSKINSLIKERGNLFSFNKEIDLSIAEKYSNAIFSAQETELLKSWNPSWKINYLETHKSKDEIKLAHHPVLEQQTIPGTTPMAEGSQKDLMIFLMQTANAIKKYTETEEFKSDFIDDYRKERMINSLKNAHEINKNFKNRLTKIRKYFQKIKVVDEKFDPEKREYINTNSKTFAIIAFPPTTFGSGESMIHTISKYPFIYEDIGLKQVFPKSIKEHAILDDHDHDESLEKEIFSVDDNGWWWSLGNSSLDSSKLLQFNESADTALILANKEDWNLLKSPSSNILKATSSILRKNTKRSLNYSQYHLWNEGLRSPIALNLLLDDLIDIFQKQYDENFSKGPDEYKNAMDWGNYWSECFIKGEDAKET